MNSRKKEGKKYTHTQYSGVPYTALRNGHASFSHSYHWWPCSCLINSFAYIQKHNALATPEPTKLDNNVSLSLEENSVTNSRVISDHVSVPNCRGLRGWRKNGRSSKDTFISSAVGSVCIFLRIKQGGPQSGIDSNPRPDHELLKMCKIWTALRKYFTPYEIGLDAKIKNLIFRKRKIWRSYLTELKFLEATLSTLNPPLHWRNCDKNWATRASETHQHSQGSVRQITGTNGGLFTGTCLLKRFNCSQWFIYQNDLTLQSCDVKT
jgi:hypothetical protein